MSIARVAHEMLEVLCHAERMLHERRCLVEVSLPVFARWIDVLGEDTPSLMALLIIASDTGIKNQESYWIDYFLLDRIRWIRPLGDPGINSLHLLENFAANNMEPSKKHIVLSQQEIAQLKESVPFGFSISRMLSCYFGEPFPLDDPLRVSTKAYYAITHAIADRYLYVTAPG